MSDAASISGSGSMGWAAGAGLAAGSGTHLLAEVYRVHFDRLYAVARAVTGRDEAFCMDVVQDAFVAYIRRSPRCAGEAELAAWLRRCAIRKAVDRIREEKRRGRREQVAMGAAGDGGAVDAERGDQVEWLRSELDELPASELELLGLRFGMRSAVERTLEETGRERGLSAFAVHGRIRRLVARLRERAMELFS